MSARKRTVWLATLAALTCATPPAISGPLPLPQDPHRPKPDLATPAIPAGGAVVVLGPATRPWPDGDYTIRAAADVMGTVAETIEMNSRGQARTSVP